MADFQSNFVPAFPFPVKWSVGDNTFDDADKNPKTIGLAIPVESIPGFISLLMAKIFLDLSMLAMEESWGDPSVMNSSQGVSYKDFLYSLFF